MKASLEGEEESRLFCCSCGFKDGEITVCLYAWENDPQEVKNDGMKEERGLPERCP